MHATVAAFSSNIATIPVAYSRKFAGLYENIGYDILIDLKSTSLEEALVKTMGYIRNSQEIKEKVSLCHQQVFEKTKENKELLRKFIKNCAVNEQ